MKIICDTNIWYDYGYNNLTIEGTRHLPLVPTYLSITELLITEGIADNIKLLRPSVQAIFHFQKFAILDSPLIHIAKLNGYKSNNCIDKGLENLLKGSELIAKGHEVATDKVDAFRSYVDGHKKKFDEAAIIFNDMALSIKAKIPNKPSLIAHRKEDTIEINKQFISHIVGSVVGNQKILDGFDFNKIELLLYTMDHFFKELETTGRKMQPNDWNDLFFLSYVQPGDYFWTHENKWKKLITEAGMEKYLYEKLDKTIVKL